jgi:hypothetical protein
MSLLCGFSLCSASIRANSSLIIIAPSAARHILADAIIMEICARRHQEEGLKGQESVKELAAPRVF